MADTGEAREIKSRADAKEAEVVAELKKLLQESVTAAHQTSRRRRRADKKEICQRVGSGIAPGDSRHTDLAP